MKLEQLLIIFGFLYASVTIGCKSNKDIDIHTQIGNPIIYDFSFIDIRLCPNCLVKPDVHRYEDSLKSSRINLLPGQIVKAFLGGLWEGADSLLDSRLKTYYVPGWPTFRIPPSQLEVYLRAPKGDTMPWEAILYEFYVGEESIMDSNEVELRSVLIKYFYSDPILNGFHEKNLNNSFLPNLAFQNALFANIHSKIEDYFAPMPVEPELRFDYDEMRPYWKPDFFDRKIFSGGNVSLFDKTSKDIRQHGSFNSVFAKAPLVDQCFCGGWNIIEDKYKGTLAELNPSRYSGVTVCMSPAAEGMYYVRPKVQKTNTKYILDIEPQDLAIYLGQSRLHRY
jgi:hypothetical protein